MMMNKCKLGAAVLLLNLAVHVSADRYLDAKRVDARLRRRLASASPDYDRYLDSKRMEARLRRRLAGAFSDQQRVHRRLGTADWDAKNYEVKTTLYAMKDMNEVHGDGKISKGDKVILTLNPIPGKYIEVRPGGENTEMTLMKADADFSRSPGTSAATPRVSKQSSIDPRSRPANSAATRRVQRTSSNTVPERDAISIEMAQFNRVITLADGRRIVSQVSAGSPQQAPPAGAGGAQSHTSGASPSHSPSEDYTDLQADATGTTPKGTKFQVIYRTSPEYGSQLGIQVGAEYKTFKSPTEAAEYLRAN